MKTLLSGRVDTSNSQPVRAGESARYWLLLHQESKHTLGWDDGESLLALASAVREGTVEPQPFRFVPHNSPEKDLVEFFLHPDSQFALLTQYGPPEGAKPSHWFG
jgi:hypothetical protein